MPATSKATTKPAPQRKPAPQPKRAYAMPLADRWTAEKRTIFLTALAEKANVSAAARLAGMPGLSPYHLRRADLSFAAAWESAIDIGYQRLELLLLRRATYGDHADGEDAPAISTPLALGLLKARQTIARRGPPNLPVPMYGDDVRRELDGKLSALRRRVRTDG